MPDTDLNVDKKASCVAIIADGWGKVTKLVILHSLTTKLPFTVIEGFVVALRTSIYMPLLSYYCVGCIERTQEGSWLGKTLYSLAYNYAAESGNT